MSQRRARCRRPGLVGLTEASLGFGLGVLSDVRVAKSIVVARRLEWTGSPGSRWGEDPAAAIRGSWR